MEIASFGGGHYLYTASGADGGLTVFGLDSGMTASQDDSIAYSASSGTAGVLDIEFANIDGERVLIPSGRYDNNLAIHELASNGGFSNANSAWPTGTMGGFTSAIVVSAQSNEKVMIAAQFGVSGIGSYTFNAQTEATQVSFVADDANSTLQDVAAIAGLWTSGQTFAFAASVHEDGLTSFRVNNNGTLTRLETIGAEDGVGIGDPSAIATVLQAGAPYAVLGASGSNSLSVFWVAGDGTMHLKDMIWDTLETRFEGVGDIEYFKAQGRDFLIAGGTDGGLTLFELLPGGKLFEHDTFLDGFNTALGNITSIEALVLGTEVQVFAASTGENGITQLTLDMSGLSWRFFGSGAGEAVHGNGGSNVVSTGAGSDWVYGWGGNDILDGGAGRDHLIGGDGSDVFIADAWNDDVVRDFVLGEDRIDVSDWIGVYQLSALDIQYQSYGFSLHAGAHTLWVNTANGQGLDASDFSADDFIF